jgi:hypothetical protein
MRDLKKLYQELSDIENELDWYRKKKSSIYNKEWNSLIHRKHNIYININQLKQRNKRN